MPPKAIPTSTQNAATVPAKRKVGNGDQVDSSSDSDMEPIPSIEAGKRATAVKTSLAKSKKGIATPKPKSDFAVVLSKVKNAGRNLSPYKQPVPEVKAEVKAEDKPPAKRVRKTAESVPRLHDVGEHALAKPFVNFNGTQATIKQMRVLVTIEEYRFCDRSKQWQCRVHAEGNLLPTGTEMWLAEKHLDAGFKEGDFVSVKVNGGWTEGEVVGKTVTDGDDGWNYEIEVVGLVRATAKEVKVLSEEGKAKLEQTKSEKLENGEIKEENK